MNNEKDKPNTGLGSDPLTEESIVTDQTGDRPKMKTNPNNGLEIDDAKLNIDAPIQRHLGQKLKDSYEDLVNQPVPDRFRQLLDELESKDAQK
jgi:Anti-sigma factor NepR